jgi:NAD(P)-dependent dehydrogenase (short-subunit alcohol dehydrogenase family)
VSADQRRRRPLQKGRRFIDVHAGLATAREDVDHAAGQLLRVGDEPCDHPSPTAVLQGAINAALEGLARGLALERAPVRVNTVSPGLIDTPLHARLAEADRRAMFEQAAARLPVRRVRQPQDIAQAILFLATNPFATGSTVTVDGGGTIA